MKVDHKRLTKITEPPKIVSWFLNFCVVLLAGTFVYISASDPDIYADVVKADRSADTIQIVQSGNIVSAAVLNITEPDNKMKLLGPGSFDFMYCSLGFLAAIILLFFFFDFSFRQPFTKKAFTGLRLWFWLFLLFCVANFWRYEWFDEQVRLLTAGAYEFKKPIIVYKAEFWIAFILLRLVWMYKKGLALQSESEFTV